MRQYGMLKAIYLSFYSKKLYRDVALNWGGYAFLYLLFIVALSCLVFVLRGQQFLNHAYDVNADAIVQQVPVLDIKNGKISTPENRPYVVMSTSKTERIAVIDVTGQHKNLQDANAPLLVTENTIITQTKENEVRQTTLPNDLTMKVNPVVVNNYAQKFISFIWILFFPFVVFFVFIFRLIQVLLYSILGKIISLVMGVNQPYHHIMFITMVALTPATLLYIVFLLFNIIFPYQSLLLFLITMFYIVLGIRAAAILPSQENSTKKIGG